MDPKDELEFAFREYVVSTRHLLAVLQKSERVPQRLFTAATMLSYAIIEEWGDELTEEEEVDL
jgi:hypothetical protein